MAVPNTFRHGDIVIQTAYEPMTGDMLVMVGGRKCPLRIPAYKFHRLGRCTAELIQDALVAAKASQVIPDNRHDRGWPKQGAPG